MTRSTMIDISLLQTHKIIILIYKDGTVCQPYAALENTCKVYVVKNWVKLHVPEKIVG